MQNSAHTSLYASTLSAGFSDFENAARYALLQRLIPAIRHNLMSNFQSPVMISAMLEKRLKATDFDLATIQKTCTSLLSLTRTAAKDNNDLMNWIQPNSSHTLKLDAGVRECLSLLATDLRFRGFVIVNEVSSIHAELSSTALRSMLCAVLIALSNLSPAPADLIIRAQALPDRVELYINIRPTEGDIDFNRAADLRPLSWQDVDILAMAESVKLTRSNDGVQLTFPLELGLSSSQVVVD